VHKRHLPSQCTRLLTLDNLLDIGPSNYAEHNLPKWNALHELHVVVLVHRCPDFERSW